jgi:hypothetical protein
LKSVRNWRRCKKSLFYGLLVCPWIKRFDNYFISPICLKEKSFSVIPFSGTRKFSMSVVFVAHFDLISNINWLKSVKSLCRDIMVQLNPRSPLPVDADRIFGFSLISFIPAFMSD